MANDLDPSIIKTTQLMLGKHVKRPPLTDKLLKKPPFRFLHDIITTVLKTTGFFGGLFEEEELISDNVKDRESKVLFLNKVISVVGFTTGKSLTAKPSKIVAGQEPEKTNELLQCLAQALDQKLTSDSAVKTFKESTKLSQGTKKINETSKPLKKTNGINKLTSNSSERLDTKKKVSDERSLIRNEREKNSLSKQRENKPVKKESNSKKFIEPKTADKKKVDDNVKEIKHSKQLKDSERKGAKLEENVLKTELLVENVNNQEQENNDVKLVSDSTGQNNENLDVCLLVTKNDDIASLSTEHFIEKESSIVRENQFLAPQEEGKSENDDTVTETQNNQATQENINKNQLKTRTPENITNLKQSTEMTSQDIVPIGENQIETNLIVRPPSVRPISSRPGAPRLREKQDNIKTSNDNLLIGKVNIIVENTTNDEEEEPSIVIVDQETSSLAENEQEILSMTSEQPGHLVQQILDSQKELSKTGRNTEIEWQFGAQKAREAVNKEIDQLRFNIQGLSRLSNPSGKLLDHIQEDVEVMRQELLQWSKIYEDTTKDLIKQKLASEDSLIPLRTKLKQLNVDIVEKQDKINDLKIIIHKNCFRIEKLLAIGDVQ